MQVYQDNFSGSYVRFVSVRYRDLVGVEPWLHAALARFADSPSFLRESLVCKHLLNLAYVLLTYHRVRLDVNVDHVIKLISSAPRAVCKLLCVVPRNHVKSWHIQLFVEHCAHWIDFYGMLHSNAKQLLFHLSKFFENDVAHHLSSLGATGCDLAPFVACSCLWLLQHNLLFFMYARHNARYALQKLIMQHLVRAVRCGLMTAAVLCGPVSLTLPKLFLPVIDAHTLMLHMATAHTVPHEHLHIFEKLPPRMIVQMAARYPEVACDISASKRWIRRRSWLMCASRLNNSKVADARLQSLVQDETKWFVRVVARFL